MSQPDRRRFAKGKGAPRVPAHAGPRERGSAPPDAHASGREEAAARRYVQADLGEGRLVLGAQCVREALRAHGGLVQKLWGDRASPRVGALLELGERLGVPVESASGAELDRLAQGARHQGVAALAPGLVVRDLDRFEPTEHCPLVVLDGVTDPQNFGAVIRAAVALGTGSVLWAEHGAAPLTAATFRASAGAIEHARLFRVRSLHGAVGALEALGVTTILLDASASETLADLAPEGPVAVVIGSEERGARRAVRRACSRTARLAMTGRIDSLNASVAAALALYELGREHHGSRARSQAHGVGGATEPSPTT